MLKEISILAAAVLALSGCDSKNANAQNSGTAVGNPDSANVLIMEEGYEDVTFQKIADRCGITRTTLYIYFKNKKEIFLWSIKQLTSKLETDLLIIIRNTGLTATERLRAVLSSILQDCTENKRLFNVVLMYLLQLQKTGKNPGERVRRRILRLRHMLSTLIIEGINAGEFQRLNVRDINEMLYGLIESAIFRLAILDQNSTEEMNGAIELAINGILAKNKIA